MSKFVDVNAIIGVIGCVYQDLSLLRLEDKYNIIEEDFETEFQKILFGTAYHLYNQGAKKITPKDVEDFLSNKEDKLLIYHQSKGGEYILKACHVANLDSFDVYYSKLKKMSILRAYERMGINVRDIYDPDEIFDMKKKVAQEEFIDNCSIQDIIDKIDSRIDAVKLKYIGNENTVQAEAGDDILDLIVDLEQTPDVGAPLYGNFINTVTRGARLNKYYLRSAPSGLGKSRSMIADVCNLACDKIYMDGKGWVDNGEKQSTLYISVELDLQEVQTMMLAFLSNVDEEHIINGRYEPGERDRVVMAGKILQDSKIHIEIVPDFTMKDIEGIIKRNIRENKVEYIFFDYLSSSLGILSEISQATKGMKLREDNILFMLSTKLKDICNQYGVFLLTATQLSNDWMTAEEPNQNLLRGSKAIADKVDIGMHLLPLRKDDVKSIQSILEKGGFDEPNLRLCVYKNRRGRYKNIILWCKADLGTCRINPIFCTDYNYNLINLDNLKIKIEKEESVF